MNATRESVMQDLLNAAADSLRRKQPEEACGILAAYESLHRCATYVPYKPAGLDSGCAIKESA